MRHLILSSLILTATAAAAQETTGDIRGRLRTANGDAIAGASITVSGPDLLGSRTTGSFGDGIFQLLALPPGTYVLHIAAIGYRPVVMQGVQVRLGQTTGVGELTLEPATVVLEEITVTAPQATIDPVRTTIGGRLEAKDYAALPSERDYRSLITILPQVNTSYYGDPVNVGGSSGLENMYYVDGVNVTAPLNAATGTDLPGNFVKSVEVRAGGYEAQYGRALGAIVNAVTFTGSNSFESDVFGFLALTGAPKPQPTLQDQAALSYDVGARVSGPVVRDRLWFSAAYNPRLQNVDREITTLGTFPDRNRVDVFAGKLTWQPPWAGSMELSVFGDPRTQDRVAVPFLGFGSPLTPLNPDPYLSRVQSGGVAAALRATLEGGKGLRIEAALARSTNRSVTQPRTARGGTDPVFADFVNGTVEGGIPAPAKTHQSRLTGSLHGVLTLGHHTLGAGLDYEGLKVSNTFLDSYGIGYVQRYDTAYYVVDSEATTNTVRNLAPAGYFQDTWRVTDRLTVNAGLRWSRQALKGDSGVGGQRFEPEWQPRVGFNWLLGVAGRERVFASYGRFYQELPLNLSTLYYATYYFKFRFFSSDPRVPGATPYDSSDYTTYESDFRSIPGVQAENFDEFTLGYERVVGSSNRLSVRGIRRALRSAFQQGFDPSTPTGFILGTPGTGDLAFLPSPKREYTALEVIADGTWGGLQYQASYVLSRTWGNYTGLFSSDQPGVINPGVDYGLTLSSQGKNSTGLLPNDRTHVFKLAGTRHIAGPLGAGAFFTWQSGTPLNDLGAGSVSFGPTFPAFLAQRGSVGRSPSLWDLGLRLTMNVAWPHGGQCKMTLDMLHAFNPQRPVRIDQQEFFSLDSSGTQSTPNPNFQKAVAFQPPMTARIGVDVRF